MSLDGPSVERRALEAVLPEVLPAWLHELGNRLTAARLHLDANEAGAFALDAEPEALGVATSEVDRAAASAALLQAFVSGRDSGSIAGTADLSRLLISVLQPVLRRRRIALRVEVVSSVALTAPLNLLALVVVSAVLLRRLPQEGGAVLVSIGCDGSAQDALLILGRLEGVPPLPSSLDDAEELIEELVHAAGAIWNSPAPPSADWSIRLAGSPVSVAHRPGNRTEGR